MSAASLAEIKRTLLARPKLLDGRGAAVRILAARYKCAPAEANKKLDELRGCATINELFREVMPAEFQRELRKARGSLLDVAAKFFSALGFPVWDDHVLDLIAQGDHPASYSIPIRSLAFHACPNCADFDTLTVPYQLASFLNREQCPEGDTPELPGPYWTAFAKLHKLDDRLKPTESVDLEIFDKVFATRRTPIRFLPLVIKTIEYSTGSVFFDFDEEEVGDPDIGWSKQNVVWLREDYARALQIEKQIDELVDYLKAEPTKGITEALRLYHQARKLTNEQAKRRRRPAQGIALARIL